MNATERWPDTLLDQQRQHTDPLADEVVAQIVAQEGPEESRRLFDTLIRHLETPVETLPPVIDDFIHATRRLPEWTDWEKVAAAHSLFLDHFNKFKGRKFHIPEEMGKAWFQG